MFVIEFFGHIFLLKRDIRIFEAFVSNNVEKVYEIGLKALNIAAFIQKGDHLLLGKVGWIGVFLPFLDEQVIGSAEYEQLGGSLIIQVYEFLVVKGLEGIVITK